MKRTIGHGPSPDGTGTLVWFNARVPNADGTAWVDNWVCATDQSPDPFSVPCKDGWTHNADGDCMVRVENPTPTASPTSVPVHEAKSITREPTSEHETAASTVARSRPARARRRRSLLHLRRPLCRMSTAKV